LEDGGNRGGDGFEGLALGICLVGAWGPVTGVQGSGGGGWWRMAGWLGFGWDGEDAEQALGAPRGRAALGVSRLEGLEARHWRSGFRWRWADSMPPRMAARLAWRRRPRRGARHAAGGGMPRSIDHRTTGSDSSNEVRKIAENRDRWGGARPGIPRRARQGARPWPGRAKRRRLPLSVRGPALRTAIADLSPVPCPNSLPAYPGAFAPYPFCLKATLEIDDDVVGVRQTAAISYFQPNDMAAQA